MPTNNLDIAHLNPIKYYSRGRTKPENWLSNYMDDYPFIHQIKNYEAPMYYEQKLMKSDTIRQQFSSNFGPLSLDLMTCHDESFLTNTPAPATTAILSQPYTFFQSFIQLTSVPAGRYYFLLTAGFDVDTEYYVSEPIIISELIENSLLLEYSHRENDYDVAFDTGIVFNLRVEGKVDENNGFAHLTKGYRDQNVNHVVLSSEPYRTPKLEIGGSYGVPAWMIDKVNRILCLSDVYIDGHRYVREENAAWSKLGEKNYPMAAWETDIRDARNKRSTRFSSSQDAELFSSVVYNLKTAMFGDMAGPVSNSEVTLIEIE